MNLLRGEDLVLQNALLQKNAVPVLSRGPKKTNREDGDDTELQAIYKDLHSTLAQERIERCTIRSQATYFPANCDGDSIRVTRKMGKWHLYGYVRNGIDYLHPYEALHLIEMNRLELYWNQVIMSLQQAYGLLLNADNLSTDAYIVYSYLMRVGYVANPHAGRNYSQPRFRSKQAIRNEMRNQTQCIWYCYQLMESGRTAQALVSPDELLKSTAQSMVEIADKIRNSLGEIFEDCLDDAEEDNFWNVDSVSNRKRRAHDSQLGPTSKQYGAKSFLDIHSVAATDDCNDDVTSFRNIFTDIRLIELSKVDATCYKNDSSTNCELYTDFDLYFASSMYRKSLPGPPDFHVIVRRAADGPPSRKAILQTFFGRSFRSRILVIFVGASKSMQAYLYEFCNK